MQLNQIGNFFLIESTTYILLETNYLNTGMCKSESSQSHESGAHVAGWFLEANLELSIVVCCNNCCFRSQQYLKLGFQTRGPRAACGP